MLPILLSIVAICQTQIYPHAEPIRGLLGRYVDQPLLADPLIDPANPYDLRISQADYELAEAEAKSYGIDAFAFFPLGWKRSGAIKACIHGRVSDFGVLPILSLGPKIERERAILAEAFANPRGIFIDGKQVFFSYWTQYYNTPAQLKAKLDDVRARHGSNFVFIAEIPQAGASKYQNAYRATGDLSPELRNEIKTMYREYLRVVDGIYPGETHMERRVDPEILTRVHMADYLLLLARLAREVLDEPEFRTQRKYLSLTVVNGHENAYTRGYNTSHNGTRTLRGILDVVRAIRPDFVKFSEWDEWNENTCFQPTLYNSYATKRIVRSFLEEMRTGCPRPIPGNDLATPNLVVSFRKSLAPGEPLPIEVLNVADGSATGEVEVAVSVCDEADRLLTCFPPRRLDATRTVDARFVLPTRDLDARALQVQLAWRAADGRAGEVRTGFHPVDFAVAQSWNHKSVKQPLRDLATMTRAEIAFTNGEIVADLACAEPIRYAMVEGNGEILYLHNPNDPVSRFRDSPERAVFQVCFLSTVEVPVKQRAFRLTLPGVKDAEWLMGRTIERGESYRPHWLSMNTEPVYLSIPRSRLAGLAMSVNLEPAMSGTIPVDRAFELGAYTLGAPGETAVTLARLDRQAVYPAVWNCPRAAFRVRPGADRQTMAYCVQVVTMSGKTWRSRPFTTGSGRAGRVLDYDFSPQAGDVVLPKNGESWFRGMLGGIFSPATVRNRGATAAGALEEGDARTVASPTADRRPKRVCNAAGAWELVFDGEDDVVGFPWETVPQFEPWEATIVFTPADVEKKACLFASREPGGTGNLWGVLIDHGRISVGFTDLLGKGGWSDVSTKSGVLTPNVEHTLRLRHTGAALELDLDGCVSSAPSTLPGAYTSTALLGGGLPRLGNFKGRVRRLTLRHGR